jgi:predicted enzyme related to lactoylglutathione lyase
MGARVVHFEFNADDPERAVAFWRDVFGWQIQKWEGPADYWLASTGEGVGIDGALQGAPEFVEGQKTVVTVGVESVDETSAKVEVAGGSVVLPKMAIPGVGWLIYCRDTEGMLFGAMQSDESAA